MDIKDVAQFFAALSGMAEFLSRRWGNGLIAEYFYLARYSLSYLSYRIRTQLKGDTRLSLIVIAEQHAETARLQVYPR